MKVNFACRWNNQLQHEFDFDELIIDVTIDKLKDVRDFLIDHPTQLVILSMQVLEDFDEQNISLKDFFADLKDDNGNPFTNYKVRFPDYYGLGYNIIEKIKEECADVPYFYNTYIEDWDTLELMIQMGVSDIYLYGALGFALAQVAFMYGEKVNIRVIPNKAQSKCPENGLPVFFLRPEVNVYFTMNNITFEFFQFPVESKMAKKTDPDVLWEIYAQDKHWEGNLKDIIVGLDQDIYSPALHIGFDNFRMSCGKRCAYERVFSDQCNYCSRLIGAAKLLQDNGMIRLLKTD